MTKRTLCTLCLIFLAIRSVLFIFASGDNLVEVPASSIFSEEQKDTHIVIEGQVYKKTSTSKTQVLYLKNNSLIQKNKSFSESNIFIYDDTFSDVSIGQTICIQGKLSSFQQARNPGNFDAQLYYAKQNIHGFVLCENIMSVSGEANHFFERLYQFRQMWKTILSETMSETNSSVLSAMLLGEKSEMDTLLKEQYQKAGISHILAISGLHISFIGLGIYKLLRKAGLSFALAGFFAVLILSGYAFMVGFSVSVFRAYLMLLLRIGADITGRVYDMLTAVMLSAAILVLYQPLYLTDAAFYLSHGAVLGLALVWPKMKKLFPEKKCLQSVVSGLAVNVTLFPILLWFYFEVPTYSMLLNLIVVPLMSWVLTLGMFGSLGYVIWMPLGEVLLGGCDCILTGFDWLSQMCCDLPCSRLTFGKPAWWAMLLYYLVLTGFLSVLRKQIITSRKLRVIGVLLSMLSVLIFVKFPNDKVRVTMLDVGQGDCIYIKGPKGNSYLIDGGSSDVDEVCKYRIEPYLKAQGVASLDYVFVSHGDVDHYIGIKEMIGRQTTGVKIKHLVLTAQYGQDEELKDLAKMAMERGIKVLVIKGGQFLAEGDLQIKCLQPTKQDKNLQGNAGSMVLELSFRKFRMLFTGDVEQEGETSLLAGLSGASYDILKVAHHGSKNSTQESFLATVKPKLAWISAGVNNSYGHPHEETLERLQKVHCKIYQTMNYGAISVESDGDFIDIFPSSI